MVPIEGGGDIPLEFVRAATRKDLGLNPTLQVYDIDPKAVQKMNRIGKKRTSNSGFKIGHFLVFSYLMAWSYGLRSESERFTDDHLVQAFHNLGYKVERAAVANEFAGPGDCSLEHCGCPIVGRCTVFGGCRCHQIFWACQMGASGRSFQYDCDPAFSNGLERKPFRSIPSDIGVAPAAIRSRLSRISLDPARIWTRRKSFAGVCGAHHVHQHACSGVC